MKEKYLHLVSTFWLTKRGIVNLFTDSRVDHCTEFRATNMRQARRSEARNNRFIRELLRDGDFDHKTLLA